MQEARSVLEALEIDADPATVWRAWTEPDWLRGWMVERVRGPLAAGEAVTWGWDSLGVELELDVVECVAPARLVLRGGAAGRPPQTQSVSLSPVERGTRVELEHSGFPLGAAGDDEREGTRAGWRVMLRVLAHYLAGGPGRQRECAAVMAPVAAPLAAIGELLQGELLHRPERRAAWLGADSPLAAEGERFALRGPGGLRVTGRVLALAPPFQLALSWDEVDGVLVLRAIQVAGGAQSGAVLAGAQAWSWSPGGAAWQSARAALADAVARLVGAAGGARGSA
jgi:uncharacterized protein YndB with AHSA1/START domain